MSKAYWISVYRSVSDADALAAYAKLAGPALSAAGAKFLARGLPAAVKESGLQQRTVLIEFDSVAAALAAILDYAATAQPQHSTEPDKLRVWVEESTARGVLPEDVMNHFWEIDNKPVEDTLFWEEARCDLGKMSSAVDK